MATLPLAILSQSSLQDYYDCARRFQLRYLERLHYPAVETEPAHEHEVHQREGEYFHRLLQQHFIGIPDEMLARLANTPDLRRWWDNFKSANFSFDGYTTFPEISLSAPLQPYRLSAKYDLLAIKPGEKAVILDWKTYRRRPKNEWLAARWQTRVYRALLVLAGTHLNANQAFLPEQIEMLYWFADFPTEPASFPYTAAQFKRDCDALTTLAREIASASTYPKTDDRQKCSFCAYRSYCDRGIRAGELEQPEGEMERGELFDVNFEQIGEIEF